MKVFSLFLAAGALALAGCGGGSTAGGTLSAQSRNMGPTAINVGYNANSSLFGFSAAGTPLTDLTPNAPFDHGRMKRYQTSTFDQLAYGAQSANAIVGVAASEAHSSINFGGVNFQRIGNTTLPTSGVANYTGEYAGFFRNETTPNSEITRAINGDVMMTADFASNTVAANITNRQFRFVGSNVVNNSNLLADLSLPSTTISANGEFSGTTSGGRVTTDTWDPTNGVFQGMFAGANGGEAVGGVIVNHRSAANTPFQEIGGFHAD